MTSASQSTPSAPSNSNWALFCRSLQHHQGIRFACLVVVCAVVSFLNHDTPILWPRVIYGTIFVALLTWAPVLITAYQAREQYRIPIPEDKTQH